MSERSLAGQGSDAFTPEDLFTGERQVTTGNVTLASGQGVVPRLSVIGYVTADGKGKLSLTASNDGSEVAKCVLVHEIDTTAGDVEAQVYLTGCLNPNVLNFGTGHTAASVRASMLTEGIQLKAPA